MLLSVSLLASHLWDPGFTPQNHQKTNTKPVGKNNKQFFSCYTLCSLALHSQVPCCLELSSRLWQCGADLCFPGRQLVLPALFIESLSLPSCPGALSLLFTKNQPVLLVWLLAPGLSWCWRRVSPHRYFLYLALYTLLMLVPIVRAMILLGSLLFYVILSAYQKPF